MLVLILYLYTGCVVICASALSFDVKNLSLAVADLDKTPASRSLVERFLVTETFSSIETGGTAPDAFDLLRKSKTSAVLIVPEGFQRDLHGQSGSKIQFLLDGTNSNTAAQARGYALEIVSRFEADYFMERRAKPYVLPQIRVWYNPELSYSSFIILSMINLAAFLVGVIHPAASFVREKEVGTIEQLKVTPISVFELFVAKTTPALAMGLISVFPSLLIVNAFGVPLRGSLLLFLVLTALFLLSAIGIGVLVATVTRTLQQALLLAFFGLFPMMFLSGTIVPVESMPSFLQAVTIFSPVRHYMDVILGIFLKGAGIGDLWMQSIALMMISSVLFATSFFIFRRSWQ